MTFVGEFHEREIDGNLFHTLTFLSQIDHSSSSSLGEATIDSGGVNDLLSIQPHFLCPSLRLEAEELKHKEDGYSRFGDFIFPFMTSPHFPNVKGVGQQQVEHLFDSDNNDICKHPLLPLFWCEKENPVIFDYPSICSACRNPNIGSIYYLCTTCNKIFHKECVESPLFIKHPSYPFLSLQLYNTSASFFLHGCLICETVIRDMAYHCPIYKLNMHPVCALKPTPIFIDHPKRHPHTLTFFPKQTSLVCDVCGIVKGNCPTYVCARCVFVVHQDCIYFPYVIRISRHQHRISFTSSLPSETLSCGVCRKKVDNSCAAYTCNQCDGYFVHSRCALRRDLWDGEELEGVPEETEIVVEPFETIADGIISHFSHGHHLKLDTIIFYDDTKSCQACVLPIYEGNYYSCVDVHCDFILHETCANAPLKKHNPLNARSLALKVVNHEHNENHGYFFCNACHRKSCGFVYEDRSVVQGAFGLDLRCASISEPFIYEGHEHPLFLALSVQEEISAICHICNGDSDTLTTFCRKLNCIECNYIICFKCATLPYKARYKHDKHFLTFQKEKVVSDQLEYWCEACERKIGKDMFYACDDYCCTTLHVDCLLGEDLYMKHGQTIEFDQGKVHILRNNTVSRPFCQGCKEKRCVQRVLFEWKSLAYCSFDCSSSKGMIIR